MAHGLVNESKISAKDIDALNRSVVATVDVDGGNLIALTAPTEVGSDVWTAEAPKAGNLGGLWIAYNPTNRHIDVEGKVFAGLTADERAYTNIAGKTFDAFKPVVGDEIEISVDAIDDVKSIVAGDYLEAKAGQTKWTRVAKATGATAGSTAVQVEYAVPHDFPKAGIGVEKVNFYRCVVVAE